MNFRLSLPLAILLLISALSAFSQAKVFPDGIYLNAAQLKNKTPAFNVPLTVTIREKSERVWAGGSEYRLDSAIDSLSKKYIRKKIFAYVKGDSVFINDMNAWFSLALTQGNFIVFRTCDDPNVAAMGTMFGMVGAVAYAASAPSRLAIISLRTGNVRAFTKAYIAERLKEYPEALKQLKEEGKKPSVETLLRYVDYLNEKVALDN